MIVYAFSYIRTIKCPREKWIILFYTDCDSVYAFRNMQNILSFFRRLIPAAVPLLSKRLHIQKTLFCLNRMTG